MTEDSRYPIVMGRLLFCSGQCQRHTDHHSVIYPDTEHNTCKVCGHKSTVHFNREVAFIYREVDVVELDGIMYDINMTISQLVLHKYGHMGKKDVEFIEHIRHTLSAINRRVKRLREKNER